MPLSLTVATLPSTEVVADSDFTVKSEPNEGDIAGVALLGLSPEDVHQTGSLVINGLHDPGILGGVGGVLVGLQVLQIVDVTIVDLPLHIALHVHQLADGDIDGLLVGVELVLLIVGIVDPEGIVADGSGLGRSP